MPLTSRGLIQGLIQAQLFLVDASSHGWLRLEADGLSGGQGDIGVVCRWVQARMGSVSGLWSDGVGTDGV